MNPIFFHLSLIRDYLGCYPILMLISCFLQVFDCWFESGSMPYAYIHYPFENKELFEKNFPGHFVAEGLDQTRGWYVIPYLDCGGKYKPLD